MPPSFRELPVAPFAPIFIVAPSRQHSRLADFFLMPFRDIDTRAARQAAALRADKIARQEAAHAADAADAPQR